jgi:hypothetical protein
MFFFPFLFGFHMGLANAIPVLSRRIEHRDSCGNGRAYFAHQRPTTQKKEAKNAPSPSPCAKMIASFMVFLLSRAFQARIELL